MKPRWAGAAALGFACVVLCAGAVARADAGWFEAGDVQLRVDLQLLNDAEVIRLPVTHWPMPRESVRYALSDVKDAFATNAAVTAALARVRARLDAGSPARSSLRFSARASGGSAGLLRDFDTPAREDAELSARADLDGERFAATLNLAGVLDPADDQSLRADGSHATVKLGNWLLSANTLERWWGPGHESSLILSNNARPMPTFDIERAAARPFETPWLSWLGPWRFNLAVSRMESERVDIDAPLFLAWRVTIMPFRDVEFGFSRTAQFCGKQQACDFSTVTELLVGNDNVGIDASEENEPGNQMAGFDIRWASPIGDWPYAIYSQMIGEDESSYLPVKYLAQFGIEAWKPLTTGGIVQGFAEYADTTCSAVSGSGPYLDCAYQQRQFNVEGYRYRGRVIGHTTDADSRSYALGAIYTAPNGDVWTATARAAQLNRGDAFDANHSLTAVPADLAGIEMGWRGRMFGGALAAELGVESFEPDGADRDVEPYGFVSWRYDLP